jgi:arylsulfatase A-like enzyme
MLLRSPRPLLAGLSLLLPLAGCGEAPDSAGPREWNVLLITLDTTRADRLGCYGREGATTPGLDALAEDGVRFETAISTAGITPMSHASILTGRNNYSHGLRVFHGELGHRLPEGVPTLSGLLAERGWRTGAFVSAYPASQAYGLEQGYQDFDCGLEDTLGDLDLSRQQRHSSNWEDATRNNTQRRGDATVDEALAWLEEHGQRGPWHLWLHFFDVHDLSLVPPVAYARERGVTYDPSVSSKDVAVRDAMYDFELGYLDAQVGRVLQHLRDTAQYESTLVIVTADHGQGLSDGVRNHGWLLHRLLYDWSIHVPLLVKLPGPEAAVRRGQVVPELVRSIDLLPTVMEVLDLAPPPGIDGRSLLGLVRGELDEPRLAYADALNLEDSHSPGPRLPAGQNDNLYAVRDQRWKLIWHARRPQDSQLFDLQEDPGELSNVIADHPDEVKRLLRFLEERDAFRLVPAGSGGAGPDRGALEALGYTGGDGEDG